MTYRHGESIPMQLRIGDEITITCYNPRTHKIVKAFALLGLDVQVEHTNSEFDTIILRDKSWLQEPERVLGVCDFCGNKVTTHDENTHRHGICDVKTNPLSEMPPTNSDAEIVRAGILAEMDAVNLYEQMAGNAKTTAVREILLDIAKEEKTHIGEFEHLLRMVDEEFMEEQARGKMEVEDKLHNPKHTLQTIANALMKIDNSIWDTIHCGSGSEMQEKTELQGAYVESWRLKFAETGKPRDIIGEQIPNKVFDILEDQNYHTLNELLTREHRWTDNKQHEGYRQWLIENPYRQWLIENGGTLGKYYGDQYFANPHKKYYCDICDVDFDEEPDEHIEDHHADDPRCSHDDARVIFEENHIYVNNPIKWQSKYQLAGVSGWNGVRNCHYCGEVKTEDGKKYPFHFQCPECGAKGELLSWNWYEAKEEINDLTLKCPNGHSVNVDNPGPDFDDWVVLDSLGGTP